MLHRLVWIQRGQQTLIHMTHRHTHTEFQHPSKQWGAREGQQSCKQRDEGGGGGKLAQDSVGERCCAASSTECAVGDLKEAVVVVGMMMGTCLRTIGSLEQLDHGIRDGW